MKTGRRGAPKRPPIIKKSKEMYKKRNPKTSTLKGRPSLEGESIEAKMRRVMNNKEPIQDGAPLVFTDREEGVLPSMDIRTDKFEQAMDYTDSMTKTHLTKRDERLGAKTYDTMSEAQRQEFHTKFPDNKFSLIAKGKAEGGKEGKA